MGSFELLEDVDEPVVELQRPAPPRLPVRLGLALLILFFLAITPLTTIVELAGATMGGTGVGRCPSLSNGWKALPKLKVKERVAEAERRRRRTASHGRWRRGGGWRLPTASIGCVARIAAGGLPVASNGRRRHPRGFQRMETEMERRRPVTSRGRRGDGHPYDRRASRVFQRIETETKRRTWLATSHGQRGDGHPYGRRTPHDFQRTKTEMERRRRRGDGIPMASNGQRRRRRPAGFPQAVESRPRAEAKRRRPAGFP